MTNPIRFYLWWALADFTSTAWYRLQCCRYDGAHGNAYIPDHWQWERPALHRVLTATARWAENRMWSVVLWSDHNATIHDRRPEVALCRR